MTRDWDCEIKGTHVRLFEKSLGKTAESRCFQTSSLPKSARFCEMSKRKGFFPAPRPYQVPFRGFALSVVTSKCGAKFEIVGDVVSGIRLRGRAKELSRAKNKNICSVRLKECTINCVEVPFCDSLSTRTSEC